jgi:hypothetical protein
MSQKTEIATAVGTLGCAIAIGFVMQSGEVAELRYGSGASAQAATALTTGYPASRTFTYDAVPAHAIAPLEVRSITLTSAPLDVEPEPKIEEVQVPETAAVDLTDPVGEPSIDMSENTKETACDVKASAVPGAAAMINYHLEAPCFALSSVAISQNGLVFNETLSEGGSLDLMIPAFSEKARLTTIFSDGQTDVTTVQVDSVPLYDRVAVQSRSDSGVQVHAREAGAAYGTAGHVWSGAPRDVSAIAERRGGFLTMLGDGNVTGAHLLEVYTFPTALGTLPTDVNLSVETEVTQDNCSREIKAQAQQFSSGAQVSSQDLSLFVPDCDAIGGFLVLNNLLQDLTVALE